MKKMLMVLGGIVIILVSFISGILVGQKNISKDDLAISKVNNQTFYATIESINKYNDGRIHINVKGLEVNDINYRGNFTFAINNNINMSWRDIKISVLDLKIGNKIAITFTDEIMEAISPTPLKEVVKVQLLDDEK